MPPACVSSNRESWPLRKVDRRRTGHPLRAPVKTLPMTTFFLTCAALGGGVLVAQLVLSLLAGGDVSGHHGLHVTHTGHEVEEGLQLFSVRSLCAGLGFFGVGGLAGLSLAGSSPFGIALALLLGMALGTAAMVAVAAAVRAMLRFEDDGTVRIESAVGISGDVYLTIPADRSGMGKVHVPVQNRIVEYQAVTTHRDTLPTGARVLIVDVAGPDIVVVVPDPLTATREVFHAGH